MPSFEELLELTEVVSKNRTKNIQIIGNPDKEETLFERFYLGIVNGEFSSDEEAASEFYNSSPKAAAYQKLKGRLYDRLLNTLFFFNLNDPKYTEFSKAYYSLFKEYACMKILIGQFARNTAVQLGERILKKAQKYEFTDLTLGIAKELRIFYGTIQGDNKKYHKYDSIVNKASKLLQSELKAEKYYCELTKHYVKSNSSIPKLVEKSKRYANELKNALKKHQSYRLNILSYTIIVLSHEIANEHEEVGKSCENALNSFKKKKHIISNSVLFNFELKRAGSYILLKKFKKAEISLKNCINIVPKYSINWFAVREFYIILAFHSNKLDKALKILKDVMANSFLSKMPSQVTERWYIHEAFIKYLISIGKFSSERRRKFRIYKFLNEVPIYSKDKRGDNITILILHILFLLQQRKYDAIIDRMEALQQYCHRYLRRDDTFRSNCFIKMLLLLPPAGFHRGRVAHRAGKYLKKLEEVPLEKANQALELEVIPYETLWEFVLESLDDKIRTPGG